MQNLIQIGKTMAFYRDPDLWLSYHDAGAVCYYSDWNTYETVGLTNGQLARKQIQVSDIYARPDVQIILKNFDLTAGKQQAALDRFTQDLEPYGYQHFRNLPILFVPGQRDFVVAVYTRNTDFADEVFRNINLEAASPEATLSYTLYRIAKDLVRER